MDGPRIVGPDGRVRVGAYRAPADIALPEVGGADLDYVRVDHAVRLTAIAVDGDATLRLAFASGAALAVPRDLRYQAWQIVGPGDRLIVGTPAGSAGLAVWS